VKPKYPLVKFFLRVESHLAEGYSGLQKLNRNPANTGTPLNNEFRLDQISQRLSETEVSILKCLMQCDSNKVAAHKLQLAAVAVTMHVKSILHKIGAVN